MGLLCIQRQDLPRYFALRDDQGRDGFSPKPAHGLKAMPAVWSPETAAGRYNRDDGVEKTTGLIDHVGKALVVCVGEIALKRRRLDLVDRKNGEQSLKAAKRLFVHAHHAASSLGYRISGFSGSSFELF
jgi:hypothetical protein